MATRTTFMPARDNEGAARAFGEQGTGGNATGQSIGRYNTNKTFRFPHHGAYGNDDFNTPMVSSTKITNSTQSIQYKQLLARRPYIWCWRVWGQCRCCWSRCGRSRKGVWRAI